MSLRARAYSTLIISSTASASEALAGMLPESIFSPVRKTSSVVSAKRILAERSFDFVIINSPLSDDTGISFAMDLCSSKDVVVLLIVRQEIHDEVYDKVKEYGVFTLPKPISKPIMIRAFSWMVSARERLRHIEKKTQTLEQKMEEIRLVNRAKWLLISQAGMSEPDAHRFIEKQAMDQCTAKKHIAEKIIREYT